MKDRKDIIESTINNIPFVQCLSDFEQKGLCIVGKVEIGFDGLGNTLIFDILIEPSYPFKTHDSESIIFSNIDLIEYNHVMELGNICIHTLYSTSLKDKIIIDFNSLKNWIVKYYINKEKDSKYEHILVDYSFIDDRYYAFHFSECNKQFRKNEYGNVDIAFLNSGLYKDKAIHNFITQKFTSMSDDVKECEFSDYYTKRNKALNGLYYFIENAPAKYSKFAYTNYLELVNLFSTEFLEILHQYEVDSKTKHNGTIIPLYLGYRIPSEEIYWQVILLKVGEFPLKGEAKKIDGIKTKKWTSVLIDRKIDWGIAKDVSYKYFFGRGVFSTELTTKKILMIGIGAIGSIVAQTLVRCGCLHLDFIDYDTKEPENICRSEYMFSNGILNKTFELRKILSEISPFVNCNDLYINGLDASIKALYQNDAQKDILKNDLEKYDLIIDCSTDNDLMYILDYLKLDCDLINLSITNYAKELVCAFSPNVYRFVINQFSNVLENNAQDLYEPTGCWSPTFKASYNDINTLVQFALKHINRLYENKLQKNNFVVKESNVELKIIEF